MDYKDLEHLLDERVKEELLRKQLPPTSSGFNTASELGWECVRFQVGRRLRGELRKKVELGLARRFYVGTVLEGPVINLLREAGFKVYQDPSSVFYEWKAYQIKGRIDGKLEVELDGKKRVIPVEVKTCGVGTFNQIKRLKERGEPLTRADNPLLRKWAGQLTIYELLFGEEYGVWAFMCKDSGEVLFWVLKLDYEYGEGLLRLAEEANKWVERKELPEARWCELCGKCDFKDTLCFPDESYGEGVKLIEDKKVEEMLGRMVELEEMVKEYDELKNRLIGGSGKPGILYGKNAIVGNYVVTAKERKQMRYEVPEEIKRKFGREVVYWVHKVERMGVE